MPIEVDIETNPLDVVRAGEVFTLKQGQTVIKGEVVIEDGGEYIFPDQSSLIVE